MSGVRRPIVAGNWKMHKTIGEAVDLAAEVRNALTVADAVETVLCPPFTALKPLGDLLRYSPIRLGAQNVHWEASGAFTGEISAPLLTDLGCRFVIVGHSERRHGFGETDADVNRKARAALAAGLTPIVCVGETLEERESGRADAIVRDQVLRSLDGIGERLAAVVVAYEPVWAIGTGRTATPDQVQSAHSYIRKLVRDAAGEAAAAGVRIQYGGSVKPENARELFALPDVDGGLIGGASLQADSFIQIVHSALAG